MAGGELIERETDTEAGGKGGLGDKSSLGGMTFFFSSFNAGGFAEVFETGEDGGGLLTDRTLEVRLRFGGSAGGMDCTTSVALGELLRLSF